MSPVDRRPPVWVGHIVLESDRIGDSAAFMDAIGLRKVFVSPTMAIHELRGGTHLLLFPTGTVPNGPAAFDLMVDDLAAFHRQLVAKGFAPGKIESVPAVHHERFTVREPGGNVLTFYSTHVTGIV